jgi:hypothetical protein
MTAGAELGGAEWLAKAQLCFAPGTFPPPPPTQSYLMVDVQALAVRIHIRRYIREWERLVLAAGDDASFDDAATAVHDALTNVTNLALSICGRGGGGGDKDNAASVLTTREQRHSSASASARQRRWRRPPSAR